MRTWSPAPAGSLDEGSSSVKKYSFTAVQPARSKEEAEERGRRILRPTCGLGTDRDAAAETGAPAAAAPRADPQLSA